MSREIRCPGSCSDIAKRRPILASVSITAYVKAKFVKAFLLNFVESTNDAVPCENGIRKGGLRHCKPSMIVTAGTRTITEVRREANDQDPARYQFAAIPI